MSSLSILLSLLFLSLPSTDWARERRDALRLIKAQDLAGLSDLASRLQQSDDPVDAFSLTLECLDEINTIQEKAEKDRDRFGERLFSYYVTNNKSDGQSDGWKTSRSEKTYAEMKEKSRVDNAQVFAITRSLDEFSVTLGAVAESAAKEESTKAAVSAQLISSLESMSSDRLRTIALEHIPGEYAPELLEYVRGVASGSDDRTFLVGSMRYFARTRYEDSLDLASSLMTHEDPFVRRASYELLAGIGTQEAIDSLIQRLGEEEGVPAVEISTHLRSLLGENFHLNRSLWEKHWQSIRGEWKRPDRYEALSDAELREDWRYHGLRLQSKRVVFILDISHSMERGVQFRPLPGFAQTAKLGRVKMDIAREELLRSLNSLHEDAAFNIIAYHTKVSKLWPRLRLATEENRKKAIEWVQKLEPWGNTNMSGALLEGIAMTEVGKRPVDGEIADTILFLSDGKSTCGPIKYEEDLLVEIDRLNRSRQIIIHAISLGFEDNKDFMEDLAKRNRGQAIRVEK